MKSLNVGKAQRLKRLHVITNVERGRFTVISKTPQFRAITMTGFARSD